MGGNVSKYWVNEVPVVQTPSAPWALIGRTRQKYVLFGRGLGGEYPVATVVAVQQTLELGLKSCEKLMSSWYSTAPGTGVQLRSGS